MDVLGALGLGLISALVCFYVLYRVVRAAVRDGILEAETLREGRRDEEEAEVQAAQEYVGQQKLLHGDKFGEK